MTNLSPSAAAKAWKVGKSTIYKAMSNGNLSFTTDEAGKRSIDHSEMVRFFGEPRKNEDGSKTDLGPHARIQDLKDAIDRQERQHSDYVQALKAQIDSQQKQLNAMTESMDRITRLLEHKQPVSPKNEPAEPIITLEETLGPAPKTAELQTVQRKRSLFQRVFAAVVED